MLAPASPSARPLRNASGPPTRYTGTGGDLAQSATQALS
jgi:hypothetical protein